MYDAIIDMLESAFNVSLKYMTMDMANFAPTVYDTMSGINTVLQPIAFSLLTMFTLWNIVRSSATYAEMKRPEMIFKTLMRFIITKWAISYGWSTLSNVVGFFAGLTKLVSGDLTGSGFLDNPWTRFKAYSDPNTVWDEILNATSVILNPLSRIPLIVLDLIVFLVALVLSVTLVLTVIGRFFKIYLFACLSPLPIATFGAENTHDIGRAFLKGFLAVCLEGLIITLAMIIYGAYSAMDWTVTLGITGWVGWLSNSTGLANELSAIFNMLLLLSIIKGSDRVIQRIFGV